jgi:hypothetical protein
VPINLVNRRAQVQSQPRYGNLSPFIRKEKVTTVYINLTDLTPRVRWQRMP